MDILDNESNKEGKFTPENGPIGVNNKFYQIATAMALVWTLMVLISLITGKILIAYYGFSTTEILSDVPYFLAEFKGRLNTFRFAQMTNTLVMFGATSLVMSYLITGKFLGFFETNIAANKKSTFLIPIIFLTVLPVIGSIAYQIGRIDWPDAFDAIAKMEAQMMLLQKGLIGIPKPEVFVVNFFMIAIFPAIFEELFFRGVLQKLLIQWRHSKKLGVVEDNQSAIQSGSHHVGIIVAGLIFGAFHFQIDNFIPITLLGILLGYIYWWTKNLWFSVLAHLFFNGIQAITFFVYSTNPKLKELSAVETLPFFQTLLSLVLCMGAIYLFYQLNRATAYGTTKLG